MIFSTMNLGDLKTKVLSSKAPLIITTHQNPDGDGLGSEIAIAHCLRRLGREAVIINQDKTPSSFKFLEKYYPIRDASGVTPPEKAQILFIDMHDVESAGPVMGELLDKISSKEVFFINHHSPKYFEPDMNYILFDSASSTGEIAYRFIRKELDMELDNAVAECIYTAIISDTRSFRYSRTTSYSHQIASEILEYGIQSEKIQLEVFGSNTLQQIQLLGSTLQNTKLSNNGKVAYTHIPIEAMLKNNVTPSDTKGFINHLLTIKGVEIALLIRQDSPERVKVSIRSKGNYPIYDVAEEYGGGGHKFAASFVSNMPTEKLQQDLVAKLEKLTVETLN